eukprot:5577870-Amphidinium_carterae.1
MQKRISEYRVKSALSYRLMPESSDAQPLHHVMIGTDSGHMMIYRETQLIWCARLTNIIPVQISVAEICGVKGMIVAMDSTGKVQVCYLGTDPPAANLVNTEMKELNYDEMEEEHQELLRVIRTTHGEGAPEAEEKLVIQAQVPPGLDSRPDDDTDPEDPFGRVDGQLMQVT